MKPRNKFLNRIRPIKDRLQGKFGLMNNSGSNTFVFLMLLLLFITVSCNEETFLDKKPHIETDNSFYTTPNGAQQGINAAYDVLSQGEGYERGLFAGTVCSGDALTGGEPGGNDQPDLQRLMKFTELPSSSYSLLFWKTLYNGIYRCNLIIKYASEPLPNFDEGLRTRILGEAYYLRAYFHFNAQVTFGGEPQLQGVFNNQLKGVPYVDHVLLQEEWYSITRPELTYTWGRIEEDFKKAAELLPTSYGPSDIGRATQYAAKAMLAKTYLYQEKWEDAYQAAKEVINSENFWLIGETGHNDPLIVTRLGKVGEFETQMPGYKWIWQPEANNCKESIFDIQHTQVGTNVGWPDNIPGNLVCTYYGPRAMWVWQVDPVTKADILNRVSAFWGFMLPTNFFVKTAYKDIGCEENGKILDPRYKLTVVEATDKLPYYYADEKLRANYPDSINWDPYFNNPATGRITWKYFADPKFVALRGGLGDLPINFKAFRFADLLLIGAEAGVNSGHDADALTWINRVRDRARNSGNTGYPKALTSVTKEAVWAERRVELAFEGHQFWDMVRTGRADQILKQAYALYPTSQNTVLSQGVEVVTTVEEQFGSAFTPGKHEIWPISELEIKNTNNSLTQNPGW
jgi:starch-binding outer membrane protein, SusD/RagB family